MVLNPGPLDWESRALATRSLLYVSMESTLLLLFLIKYFLVIINKIFDNSMKGCSQTRQEAVYSLRMQTRFQGNFSKANDFLLLSDTYLLNK